MYTNLLFCDLQVYISDERSCNSQRWFYNMKFMIIPSEEITFNIFAWGYFIRASDLKYPCKNDSCALSWMIGHTLVIVLFLKSLFCWRKILYFMSWALMGCIPIILNRMYSNNIILKGNSEWWSKFPGHLCRLVPNSQPKTAVIHISWFLQNSKHIQMHLYWLYQLCSTFPLSANKAIAFWYFAHIL